MSILRKAYEKVSAETGVSQAKLKEILYGYYRTAYDIAMRYKVENKPFIMQLFYLGKIYNNDYEKQKP